MNTKLAALVGAAALAVGGVTAVVATNTLTSSTDPMGCEDWGTGYTQRECFAGGAIRNVFFYNIQGAAQFCKWKAANPVEWQAVKSYSETEEVPRNKTWLGGALVNALQSYFAAGGAVFVIKPNTSPNICKTPTLAPPIVMGVTPGSHTVTVTVTN